MGGKKVISFDPRPVPPMSEEAEKILPILKEWEARVRAGEIRSLYIVGVTDEAEIQTSWQVAKLQDSIEVLKQILSSDMIASRYTDENSP